MSAVLAPAPRAENPTETVTVSSLIETAQAQYAQESGRFLTQFESELFERAHANLLANPVAKVTADQICEAVAIQFGLAADANRIEPVGGRRHFKGNAGSGVDLQHWQWNGTLDSAMQNPSGRILVVLDTLDLEHESMPSSMRVSVGSGRGDGELHVNIDRRNSARQDRRW